MATKVKRVSEVEKLTRAVKAAEAALKAADEKVKEAARLEKEGEARSAKLRAQVTRIEAPYRKRAKKLREQAAHWPRTRDLRHCRRYLRSAELRQESRDLRTRIRNLGA